MKRSKSEMREQSLYFSDMARGSIVGLKPLYNYLPDVYLPDMLRIPVSTRLQFRDDLAAVPPPGILRAGRSDDGRTTTADSLLGLLSLGPMTGYEIRRLVEQSIGNFWTESFGQIYPALKSLLQQGLAEVEELSGEGRPLRKMYRLTPAGRDRLIHWLASPVRTQVPRNELLLKVFFGFQQGSQATEHHIRRFLDEQKHMHQRYAVIQKTLEAEQAANPGMPYWRLTVRYGLRQTEALICWAEDSLEELQQLRPRTTE